MAVTGWLGLPAPGRGRPRSPLLAPWGGSRSSRTCSWPFSPPRTWGSLALWKLIQPLRGRASSPGPSLLIRDRQDPVAPGLGRRGVTWLPPAPGWVVGMGPPGRWCLPDPAWWGGLGAVDSVAGLCCSHNTPLCDLGVRIGGDGERQDLTHTPHAPHHHPSRVGPMRSIVAAGGVKQGAQDAGMRGAGLGWGCSAPSPTTPEVGAKPVSTTLVRQLTPAPRLWPLQRGRERGVSGGHRSFSRLSWNLRILYSLQPPKTSLPQFPPPFPSSSLVCLFFFFFNFIILGLFASWPPRPHPPLPPAQRQRGDSGRAGASLCLPACLLFCRAAGSCEGVWESWELVMSDRLGHLKVSSLGRVHGKFTRIY